MKPKSFGYFLFASLTAASLACSFGLPNFSRPDTGSTETFELNEPFHDTQAIQDVNLTMMAGNFNLFGGAEAMLEGQVRYNVEEWKPTIISAENSLTVSQGELNASSLVVPRGYVVNDWDVKLGSFPMNLTLKAGLYDANMDLGGLPIHRLEIEEGGGSSEIRFDALNPEVMESFTYHSGTSDIALYGLANANFEEMAFEGGAGEYPFDFSGALQRDAAVSIDVGLSDVRILVPEGVPARVELEKALGDVDIDGAWSRDGSSYINPGSGSQLTIKVEMGAGTLQLANE